MGFRFVLLKNFVWGYTLLVVFDQNDYYFMTKNSPISSTSVFDYLRV